MGKSGLFLIAILMIATFAVIGSVKIRVRASSVVQNTVFRDDFENYTVGTFPSSQWSLYSDGNGTQYQTIVDNVSFSGRQSLQLIGSANSTADALRVIVSLSPIIGYEVCIRVDNSTGAPQQGGYNDAARVGFYELSTIGGYNVTAVWHEDVAFTYDGSIVACNSSSFLSGQVLQSYAPDQWYDVKVIVDRTNKTFSVWVNGTLEAQDLQSSDNPYFYEGLALSGRYTQTIDNFDDATVFETFQVNTIPPTIINVFRVPDSPSSAENVGIAAFVYGANVSLLSYTTDSTVWNNVSMDVVPYDSRYFVSFIPGQPSNTTVQYKVYAGNTTIGNWVTSEVYSYTVVPGPPPLPQPFVVSIYSFTSQVSIGQSILFRSIVSNGVPPYTYQWYLNKAPIEGANSDSLNFTATSAGTYSVELNVTDSTNSTAAAFANVNVLGPPEVYFSVQPVAVAPLTNLNASINGLETPSIPLSVGQNFTVEIHLKNATQTNAPSGVDGVEVHFYFGNIINYCKPIGFTEDFGQPGGTLNGTVIYAVNGFYNAYPIADNTPLPAPYDNATQFVVAAAGSSWNGEDGLVATITFQITSQPSQKMNQTDFIASLQITNGEIVDHFDNYVGTYIVQGTLRINAAHDSLVGDLNGDGKVSLDDLVLLAYAYGSRPGDANWNPQADLAAPFGVISLSDLVTQAMHYGQHNP